MHISFKYERLYKTKRTAVVDPYHLKVKEYDISLTKYYCITRSHF